ncbi:MAG: aminoglycoside phosphotransferase family protein [Frankia sp.]|nr:aminoglycoside phosphotransferase family protein [Frankia sp.]
MAAFDVLARLGVEPPELELLRFGENALFTFRERGLILRVARPEADPKAVGRTVEFVRRLAARGMPVSEPVEVEELAQPVVTSTGIVTLWALHEVDPACRVSATELGGLVRRFHELAATDVELVGPWEPFALIDPRLAAAERDGIESTLTGPLVELREELAAAVSGLDSELGVGVIHGDMHYGNVLCLPGRRLLLIDFDQVSRGPLEWDLVPNLVTARRFGLAAAEYDAFSAAYGYDLRSSPHADVLVRLRELGMVSWLLQQFGLSADVDAEIRLRVATIREPTGGPATRWTAR